MNDLLSRTFSARNLKGPYVDLEEDSRDYEAQRESEMAAQHMTKFFNEVEAIKEDMEQVRKLLSSLQKVNAQTMVVTAAPAVKKLRDSMDRDVEEVLKKAKAIKMHLEELDRANLANQRVPGCEKGSSTDRTRMSVTNSLRKTLKDLMGEFRTLREQMMSEYKETIQRRYYTVTGKHADEGTIDQMIETGEGETFLQKAIQEQGKGHIIETINEIQERHETVKEIEKNLIELHQIFLDMAVLVEAQGEQLNNIELAVQGASSFVKRGTTELQTAKKLQRNSRKWKCIAIIILLVIMLVVLVPILVKVLPSLSSNKDSSSSSSSSSSSNSSSSGSGS